MTEKIVLDKDFSIYSADLEYSFDLVKNLQDGRQRRFTTISNQDPAAARHFGFQPGQSNPSIEWIIFDNGEDKSNGSLQASNINDARFSNDTVVTVQEQIIWIIEYIADNTSDPRWRLFGGRFTDRNRDGSDVGTPVVVKRPSIDQTSDRPNSARAKISLKLGVTV